MKLFKLYKNIITESNAEFCIKNYGQDLFGNQLGSDEPNTDTENMDVHNIVDFTGVSFGEDLTNSVVNTINRLKKCIDVYPEILIPEKTKLYRGTVVPILTLLKKSKQFPTAQQPVPFVYRGKSIVQSWSESLKSTQVFGRDDELNDYSEIFDEPLDQIDLNDILEDIGEMMVPIIIEYESNSEDFLFRSKYLSKLSNHPQEMEVIRINNNPITVNAYLNSYVLSNKSQQLLAQLNNKL